MKLIHALAGLAALPLLASAHFTLDYPYSRGFDEDLEPQFCGGFSTPSSGRTPFPLSGSAPVLIDSHHPSAIVGMFISFDSNPSNFSAFNQTASGQQYGLLDPFGGISGTGEFCFRVDIASLGVSGLTNGSVATLQVEFNGGDGSLFQCSDLVLVDNYSVPSNVTCQNATSSTSASSSAGASASGSTGAAGAKSTGSPSSGAGRILAGSAAATGLVAAVGALTLMI
ncbi:hypothetical protein BMF94_4694 [Rhodotorula taiwanensis]|uniref:Copper acquisition factor BIM1-like domain-containing protein n=1 Tax=Rhodotorula taiwanensis TaxID=741276 RepID=A0A2S5B6I5_9BASI|nr:hypothetical protein BMF94_4694 [Rhodotorula taiwanensis]